MRVISESTTTTLTRTGAGNVYLALRSAINQAPAGVGMPSVSWGEAIAPGAVIRATHIMELRNALR